MNLTIKNGAWNPDGGQCHKITAGRPRVWIEDLTFSVSLSEEKRSVSLPKRILIRLHGFADHRSHNLRSCHPQVRSHHLNSYDGVDILKRGMLNLGEVQYLTMANRRAHFESSGFMTPTIQIFVIIWWSVNSTVSQHATCQTTWRNSGVEVCSYMFERQVWRIVV